MKDKLEIVSKAEWLDILVDKDTEYSINTCRYDCRNFDWVLPHYQLKEHLLVFHEQGFLELKLKEKNVRVEPGTMIWFPPGASRTLWGEKSKLSLHHYKIRFNIWRDDTEYTFTNSSLVRKNAWDILPYFQLLVKEHDKNNQFHDQQIKTLISTLSIAFFNLPESCPRGHKSLNNLQQAIINNFIAVNIQVGIGPRDLADELNLTLDYFSRVFKNTYGITPQGYIKQEKIYYAASFLIESNISVKELANELNYANINLFCRQFKDIIKMTPTQYRRNRLPSFF